MFGLKRYIHREQKEVHFKVEPWKKGITGLPDNLVDRVRQKGPVVTGVKEHWQYRLVVEIE
jgi:hypothetical protein